MLHDIHELADEPDGRVVIEAEPIAGVGAVVAVRAVVYDDGAADRMTTIASYLLAKVERR